MMRLKLYSLYLMFIPATVLAGAAPLVSKPVLVELYGEVFDTLDQVNNDNLFSMPDCGTDQLLDGRQSFCQDPLPDLSDASRWISDPTGLSFRELKEGSQVGAQNTLSVYEAPLTQVIQSLTQKNEGSQLAGRIQEAFPNAENPNRCAANVMIQEMYGLNTEGDSIFATGQECETTMRSLSRLLQDNEAKGIQKEFKSRVFNNIENSRLIANIKDNIFPMIKNIFRDKIIGRIQDPTQKAKALETLDKITYNQEICNQRYGLSESQAALFGETETCFSVMYLQRSNSLFQIVHTLGHEIGHAFDNCSSFCREAGDNYPWQAEERGVRDALQISDEADSCREGRTRVVREAVSDVFGTVATYEFFRDAPFSSEEFRRGYTSTLLNLLVEGPSQTNYNDYDSHPITPDRYRLMFDHPGIRMQMSCGGGNHELYP